MSKPALRYLSLGFLVSAIVLAGYRLFLYDAPAVASKGEETQEVVLTKEEASYKDKYEALLAETEVANLEKESTTSESEVVEEEATSESAESAESEVEEPSEKKITVVINDGDPSSVASQQLAEQGLIDDAFDFDKFLETNSYASLIRPGSYEVSSEMTYDELANVLMENN
ncbi:MULTISPECIES: hypothetical protein [Carnobacterium]|jgi:hypothetical protein|uniref:Aminodeoxychorismate lyase n=2 Tax=Carnobacterium inhibens TaxID=147709 RepID=U5S9C0_9LACT|nr:MULTISPECIES: hypothetical protein [Carnobacterium]AGY81840.1 hypothetical protein Q783_06140 [Carnobacterium inhibens subsp. gilichinskyi]MBC9826318.1 hypothetical protein [Carnobacterium inhibens]MDN5372850.1 hypothetical protein [Carnobacterium sp.]